jgi:hypothetical protein
MLRANGSNNYSRLLDQLRTDRRATLTAIRATPQAQRADDWPCGSAFSLKHVHTSETDYECSCSS